jgi:Domain of unknown function (DUF4304)
MAVSPYVKALDDIQKALTGFLKPLGFKKKDRTYNRQVGDGLVQAVNLQMGQFPIGDYVIPGGSPSLPIVPHWGSALVTPTQ